LLRRQLVTQAIDAFLPHGIRQGKPLKARQETRTSEKSNE
jgi:hypothetical protein